VSPNKTWEGFFGGVLSATALGAALWWPRFYAAAVRGNVVHHLHFGICGGLVMSAIKRDIGIKDFGRVIEGHAESWIALTRCVLPRRFFSIWCGTTSCRNP